MGVNTVIGQNVKVVESGQLIAQMAHLGRIVVDRIKHLIDRDGLINSEMYQTGDFEEKRRGRTEPIVRTVLFHFEAHIFKSLQITINGAATHTCLLT